MSMITGADISQVCSEELLESHLVPQLNTSKSESKGNQNHDEQQPSKVSNYGLSACILRSYMDIVEAFMDLKLSEAFAHKWK